MSTTLFVPMKSRSHQGPCSKEPVIVLYASLVKVSMLAEAGHLSPTGFNPTLILKLHHHTNILEYHKECSLARTVLQGRWNHRITYLFVTIQLISTINNHTQVLQLATGIITNSWGEMEIKSFQVNHMSFKQDQSKNQSLKRAHQSSTPMELEARHQQQAKESKDWSQEVDIHAIVSTLEKFPEICQEIGLENTLWVTWKKRLTTMKRRKRREKLRKKRDKENNHENNQERTAWREVIRVVS